MLATDTTACCRFTELEEAANANQAALLASLEAEEQCAAAAKTKRAHRGKKKKKDSKGLAAQGLALPASKISVAQQPLHGAGQTAGGVAERGDSAQEGSSERGGCDLEEPIAEALSSPELRYQADSQLASMNAGNTINIL